MELNLPSSEPVSMDNPLIISDAFILNNEATWIYKKAMISQF